ncbi:MAG: Flp pilus assembly complex ATPase component TadA [Candidatus Wallbacteria bacterium]|nr:Flp pilus assembly complex ATPase component TadA [Candidatus Wallbacteria bacterium]
MASEFIQKKRIGEILISKGLITPQQLESALAIQREDRSKRVGEIWVEAGIITEEVLSRALAFQYGVSYFDLANFVPREDMRDVVSDDLVNLHQVLPVKLDGNVLTLVTHDPTNIAGFQTIARITGFHVKFVVAQKSALQKLIAKYLASTEETLADVDIDEVLDQVNLEVASREDDDDRMDGVDLDSLRKESNQGAIVQFVNKLLLQAIQERTTDIHIESTLKDVLMRYRIDGLLYDRAHVDRKNYNAILSRIKILCDVDITERTIPQDGGFKVKLKGKNIDFRVSILPSIYGQNVVIRILGASGLELKLSELGFEPNDLIRFQKGIFRPYGWVLVTGPTGSGKTTTLYSSLSTLNKRDTKIITVEDPVEYKLAGIHQTQVRINKSDPERSLTFAKALRSILRQDPDVIMIGEIRDYETAEIAIQASLTGHLVFATIHANTSVDTIGRLQNIGIDNYLFAAALNVIVAQRLVRRICPDCKERVSVTREDLIASGLDIDQYMDYPFYKGRGCDACNKTGVRGREAIFEVMLMSDELRQMIIDNASLIAVREQALKEGMRSLHDSCKTKVLAGSSPLEDLIRMYHE